LYEISYKPVCRKFLSFIKCRQFIDVVRILQILIGAYPKHHQVIIVFMKTLEIYQLFNSRDGKQQTGSCVCVFKKTPENYCKTTSFSFALIRPLSLYHHFLNSHSHATQSHFHHHSHSIFTLTLNQTANLLPISFPVNCIVTNCVFLLSSAIASHSQRLP